MATEDVLAGHPRIEGTRIGVLFVTQRVEKAGLGPQTVADRHGVAVADVYRALAYYHEHPREMKRVRQQREQATDQFRMQIGRADNVASTVN